MQVCQQQLDTTPASVVEEQQQQHDSNVSSSSISSSSSSESPAPVVATAKAVSTDELALLAKLEEANRCDSVIRG